MSNLVVQKYGGSCLANPEKIKAVAQRIAKLRQKGTQAIVVVSAMGKTTDDLIRLAREVSPHPNRRELDMLLTTGERVSMTLMSMALMDLGCPAISFTGSQAGVFTDDSHSNARIMDVKPVRIEQELSQGRVVVLAGFQGVNPLHKEVTTLGRGGSDTTAVAMAGYFKAQRCEILKDVDGIYSADPSLVTEARPYSQLPIRSVGEMCFWGAKVLHYRCVELAQRMGVPLYIGRADNPEVGTLIAEEVNMFEAEQVLSVNVIKNVMHVHVPSSSLASALSRFSQFLDTRKEPWPQLLATIFDRDHTRLMLTAAEENLSALQSAIGKQTDLKVLPGPHALISLTCHGSVNSGMVAQVTQLLENSGVAVEKTLSSSVSLSVVVAQKDGERAVRVLHQLVK